MTTKIRDAAARLRPLIAKHDLVPILQHYIMRDGMLYASDGKLSGGTPVDCTDSFAVLAPEFHKFLDKTPGDVKLSVLENGHVKLQAGRYRATIPGVSVDQAPSIKAVEGQNFSISDSFVESVKRVRPFVSSNAAQPWAVCISIKGNNAYASNNVVVARSTGVGLPDAAQFQMPFDAADFILSKREGLEQLITGENATSFIWKDGSFINIPAHATNWPNVDPVFEAAIDPKWQVTDEWRESLLHLIDLTGSDVVIAPTGMKTAQDNGTTISSKVKSPEVEGRESTTWNGKYIREAIVVANYFEIFMAGGAPRAAFKSEGLTGIIAGMV